MDINNNVESENFVQHVTSNRVENCSYIETAIRLVEPYAQLPAADDAKFYDRSLAITNE